MVKYIIKRDGSTQEWDKTFIAKAVKKAMESSNTDLPGLAECIASSVENSINEDNIISIHIEDVQDRVQYELMRTKQHEVATEYIIYRHERAKTRVGEAVINDINHTVDDYINIKDWRANENANTKHSYQGLILHTAGSVQARYTLNMYSKEVREAHEQGYFHIHDLSMGLTGYCCGYSLRDLLLEGFNCEGFNGAKAPKRLDVALGQINNFLGTLQNEWSK